MRLNKEECRFIERMLALVSKDEIDGIASDPLEFGAIDIALKELKERLAYEGEDKRAGITGPNTNELPLGELSRRVYRRQRDIKVGRHSKK